MTGLRFPCHRCISQQAGGEPPPRGGLTLDPSLGGDPEQETGPPVPPPPHPPPLLDCQVCREVDTARGVGRAQATMRPALGSPPRSRFPVYNVLPIPGHRRGPTPQVLPEESAVSVSVMGLGEGRGKDHTAQVPCHRAPPPRGSPPISAARGEPWSVTVDVGMGEVKGPRTVTSERAGFRWNRQWGLRKGRGRHPQDRSPPTSWLSPLHHRGLVSELKPQELCPRVQQGTQGPRSQMPLWGPG